MNGKERLKNALNHKDGPVPIDFGSTTVTGMHASCIEDLRKYYGLERKPVKIIESYQMLGEIDDELGAVIGVDSTGLISWKNMFGVENTGWKNWITPWGQEVLVPENFLIADEGNDIIIFPQGDSTVSPSGRLPEGGYFFDTIIRQQPFTDDELKVEDNLEEYGIIEDKALLHYKKEAERLNAAGLGVVGAFGGTSLGDIALVPGPALKAPKGIRDISEWYMSTVIRQEYIHGIFEKQTEIALENLNRIYSVVGEAIQVAFICGTDFGTQNSQFCSTETFSSLYLPYYKRINNWIHKNTGWKTFKHSCGAVADFMPYFIEAGFDIINPLQFSAKGMDPVMIKKEYGAELTFWGGGVDTQHTLPFGTPEEIKAEVFQRCEILSQQGGFVFDAIHNVQAKTPVENIVAMIDAVNEFNK